MNSATDQNGQAQGPSGLQIGQPVENPTGATGHGSNTDQSGQSITINKPVADPTGEATYGPTNIGTTGHGSNTDQSGQAITINKPVENPTGAMGHSGNTNQSGEIDNGYTINPDAAIGKPAEANKGITDLYMQDGNDYYIDDTALSNAQMQTGDDKKADSVVGSGGDGSDTNSNINTGVFGGSSRAAHPGYSLW